MNKIIIQNLVEKHNGGTEQELDSNETIRFEFENKEITVKIEDGGLRISKTMSMNDQIEVRPMATNTIIIL